MYNSWNEVISSNFNLNAPNKKGWQTLQCPVCNDRKTRAAFLITQQGFGYSCLRGKCNHKIRYDNSIEASKAFSSMSTLFQSIGLDDSDWTHLLYIDQPDLVPVSTPQEKLAILPEIELPYRAVNLLDGHPDSAIVEYAIDYLLKRKIDPLTETFYITAAKPLKDQLDFRNRLIIPFYYKKKLIFYQGAWIHLTWRTKLKYLNTNLSDRGNLFYNMDELDRITDEPLFILEGVFDARWFQNAIGTLSNTLTDQQILRLNKSKRRKIDIPDNDKAGASIVQIAINENWEVSFPDWYGTHKDLDDAIKRIGRIRAAQEIMKEIKTTDFEKELVREFLLSVK